MKHLDLFSGIGGFAYAAQQVWGSDYECVGFCDNDWFCQQVLTKNFPGVPIHSDIRALTNTALQRIRQMAMERQSHQKDPDTNWSVGLVTGGFPCQSFSQAGSRRGTADVRYLWPEMFAVIQSTKPEWVIAENVSGLITWNEGMVLERVCSDLEAESYEVQAFVIPAAGVNAPHRRYRIWFVAHAQNIRHQGGNTAKRRYKQSEQKRDATRDTATREDTRPDWEADWPDVAARLCRVDDGLPKRLVRFPDGTTTSEARWRKEALKAYGNAIVPQVAMEIMKAIKVATKTN